MRIVIALGGSMGPEVDAAFRSVTRTGPRAIGSLADVAWIVAGTAGTNGAAEATSSLRQRSGPP